MQDFTATSITLIKALGPVSERRLSENSEYINPEMRETPGFPFQKGRFVKPEKAGSWGTIVCIGGGRRRGRGKEGEGGKRRKGGKREEK